MQINSDEHKEKKAYNALVKQRLAQWKAKYEAENCVRIDYTALSKRISSEYALEIPAETVGMMFNIKSNYEVKPKELVALSQLFGEPLLNWCKYSDISENLDVAPLISRNKKVVKPIMAAQLKNPFVEGQYFCYYFRQKNIHESQHPIQESDLEEAFLEIKFHNGQSILSLKENKKRLTFYKDKELPSFTLEGRLYRIKDYGSNHFENDYGYSFITDSTGRRAMAIVFRYTELANLTQDIPLTAALLSVSANQTPSPIFEKIVIFRSKQEIHNNETQDRLRGFLALNKSGIVVQSEACEEHGSMKMRGELTYAFLEEELRRNLNSLYGWYEAERATLLLKRYSILSSFERSGLLMPKQKNVTRVGDEQTEQFDYNSYVKQRLIDWRKSYEINNGVELNLTAIAKKMKEEFRIETSPQKLSAMFNSQRMDREVKLQELVALAHIFRIPLQDLCGYPNAPTIDEAKLLKRNNGHDSGISQMRNKFYEGKYYCYYFRPKHRQDELHSLANSDIEEAEMTISICNGDTFVKLKELQSRTTFDKEKPIPGFVLSGKLLRLDSRDIAYSMVVDPTGRRAMFLMFRYLELSDDIRYYITLAVLNISANQVHDPLFEKMAAFRIRQNYKEKETENILRGILSLNTSPILLDENTISQLIKNNKDLEDVLSPTRALYKCYAFSETAFRSSASPKFKSHEITDQLLRLRKESYLSAYEIVAEPDSFADYIKVYQQEQMPNEEQ